MSAGSPVSAGSAASAGSPPSAGSPVAVDAAAVATADIHPLLCAVAEHTADLTILREDLRPEPLRMLAPDGGLAPRAVAEARAVALDALARHGSSPSPPPSTRDLDRLLSFMVGDRAATKEREFLLEELCRPGDDLRAPSWHARGRPFSCVVIGAGMSGLLVAHRLRQARVDVTVLEKNADVGGTWFENSYPGCRVDVPNQLYSYSFAQTDAWAHRFSPQPALLDYFRRVANELGVAPCIRFGTEVTDAAYDPARRGWTLRARSSDGRTTTVDADVVVSAVGQLNRPSWPAIAGRERFAGPSFHSAEWDHGQPLEGRRVAVIGTGASAFQFIPEVAKVAGHVTVYQRTPPWLSPTPGYRDELPAPLIALQQAVPSYARWDRLWQFWQMHDGLHRAAQVDPAWTSAGSVSESNDQIRALFEAHIRSQLSPGDELLQHVLPAYPPLAKRVLRDDGSWIRTLRRENVRLEARPIAEITADGVATTDGVIHPADVIIYGTGFSASAFLTPMRVTGTDASELHERWDGDARAYLGMTLPGFPNLFLMYGPNTNLVVNGSIIVMAECQARYIVESLGALDKSGYRTMNCRAAVHDAYNEEIDDANARMAWGAADVHTWYRNDRGRVSQNWPHSLFEYWRRTRRPDLDDYELS